MKIAIIFVGTAKYAGFFDGYEKSINKYFLPDCEKDFFVFTDNPELAMFDKPNVNVIKIEHYGWPQITLHRFKFINSISDRLLDFDYVFFIDADLWPCVKIETNDIIKSEYDYVGVQHPGFVDTIGTFETNTLSTANVLDGNYNLSIYRQGCFWGGKTAKVLEMVKTLDSSVDLDSKNGVMAIWHDESHMNKYFLQRNDKIYTLNPGYAMPQHGFENIKQKYKPMMIHLYKNMNEFPRFEGAKQ